MHKIRYYKQFFMLEFVDSGLYFVQDENNFINPLLQVGSGSGSSSLVYKVYKIGEDFLDRQ